ncbi:MAG: response regulator [Chloroflexi bacterium]|nr:response regulator [Chloroflexota bacterium]
MATESPLPTEEFKEQIKQIVEHLYDFAYLQSHLLVLTNSELTAESLRQSVIEAIEALSPGPGATFNSPNARLYNVVNLHYVEGLTIQETAYELGVSERQVYRYLRRGERSIAAMLWHKLQQTEPSDTKLNSLNNELDDITVVLASVNLSEILFKAEEAVAILGRNRDVDIETHVEPSDIVMTTDKLIARQVIVNVLSSVMQQCSYQTISIYLTKTNELVSLTLKYVAAGSNATFQLHDITKRLIRRLRWQLALSQDRGMSVVQLTFQAGMPHILVIDDNQGMYELVNRYLTPYPVRVYFAQNGKEGMRLIKETRPELVLLDIMIPEVDGWEVLQRIRVDPLLRDIPIVICSVFKDIELAMSLGAKHVLSKPLQKHQLVEVLRKTALV